MTGNIGWATVLACGGHLWRLSLPAWIFWSALLFVGVALLCRLVSRADQGSGSRGIARGELYDFSEWQGLFVSSSQDGKDRQ
jgi:hypothetical protein